MEQEKSKNLNYPELAGFVQLTVKEPGYTDDKSKVKRYFPIDVVVEFGNQYFVTKQRVIEVEENAETIIERIRTSRRMLMVEKMSAALPPMFKIPDGGKILKFAPTDLQSKPEVTGTPTPKESKGDPVNDDD